MAWHIIVLTNTNNFDFENKEEHSINEHYHKFRFITAYIILSNSRLQCTHTFYNNMNL